MPFDEEDNDDLQQQPKIGLKNVSSQSSIFDKKPKVPTQQEFQEKVKQAVDKNISYKEKAASLATQFKKMMQDKTLPQNKNVFAQGLEKEVLANMIQLAVEINNDPNEQEGMGSLTWITLLLSSCLSQRDKINQLEYLISDLQKTINLLSLDKKKASE